MAQLFVPIRMIDNRVETISTYKLFEVVAEKHNSTIFNAFRLESQTQKLHSYFGVEQNFDFQIKRKVGAKEESTNIDSISLGVLCSAYAAAKNRGFKQKYDFITTTGNYDVQDGKIILKGVADVEEKYKAVQNYASVNADKKHLFLYVSSEEIIPEGLQENNVFVIRYDSSFPVECVFAEFFEPTDIQKQCIQSLLQYILKLGMYH